MTAPDDSRTSTAANAAAVKPTQNAASAALATPTSTRPAAQASAAVAVPVASLPTASAAASAQDAAAPQASASVSSPQPAAKSLPTMNAPSKLVPTSAAASQAMVAKPVQAATPVARVKPVATTATAKVPPAASAPKSSLSTAQAKQRLATPKSYAQKPIAGQSAGGTTSPKSMKPSVVPVKPVVRTNGPSSLADSPFVAKVVQGVFKLLQTYGPLTQLQLENNLPSLPANRFPHPRKIIRDILELLVTMGLVQVVDDEAFRSVLGKQQGTGDAMDAADSVQRQRGKGGVTENPKVPSIFHDPETQSTKVPLPIKYCISGGKPRTHVVPPNTILREIQLAQKEWIASKKRRKIFTDLLKQQREQQHEDEQRRIAIVMKRQQFIPGALTPQPDATPSEVPLKAEQRARQCLRSTLREFPEIIQDPLYVAALRNFNIDIATVLENQRIDASLLPNPVAGKKGGKRKRTKGDTKIAKAQRKSHAAPQPSSPQQPQLQSVQAQPEQPSQVFAAAPKQSKPIAQIQTNLQRVATATAAQAKTKVGAPPKAVPTIKQAQPMAQPHAQTPTVVAPVSIQQKPIPQQQPATIGQIHPAVVVPVAVKPTTAAATSTIPNPAMATQPPPASVLVPTAQLQQGGSKPKQQQ